jgi:hypothetical protein
MILTMSIMCSFGNTLEYFVSNVTYFKAVAVRFELTEVLPSLVFKTSAINRTLPRYQ